MRFHPLKSFTQSIQLKNSASRESPRKFIRCSEYPSPQYEVISKKVREDPRWRYCELPTGYDAMVTMPEERAYYWDWSDRLSSRAEFLIVGMLTRFWIWGPVAANSNQENNPYQKILAQQRPTLQTSPSLQLLDESLQISTQLGMRPLMERVLSRRDILKA